jgi:hypothetical protein
LANDDEMEEWAAAFSRPLAVGPLLFIDLPDRYQTSLGNSRALNLTSFRAPAPNAAKSDIVPDAPRQQLLHVHG